MFFVGLVLICFGVFTLRFLNTDSTGQQLMNFSHGVFNVSQTFFSARLGK